VLSGRPLLHPVMQSGRRLEADASLDSLADYARAEIAKLPPSIRALERATEVFQVKISERLQEAFSEIRLLTAEE
jgi:hypothetical protein